MSKQKSITVILLFVACIIGSWNSFAQEESAEVETEPKKKLNLTFRFDYGMGEPISMNNRFMYSGERLQNNNTWIWVDETRDPYNENGNIYDQLNQVNLKFDFMLSATEGLNLGVSYQLLYHQLFYPEGIFQFRSDFIYFSIAAIVDYEYETPFLKNAYINPSFSMGTYQSNYLTDGTGNNIYYDARLALKYRLFNRIGVRVWGAYDHWFYRENKQSEIFPENQRIEKIDFRYVNWGIGLEYRFFIYPD